MDLYTGLGPMLKIDTEYYEVIAGWSKNKEKWVLLHDGSALCFIDTEWSRHISIQPWTLKNLILAKPGEEFRGFRGKIYKKLENKLLAELDHMILR
jgi:hypothetical protein